MEIIPVLDVTMGVAVHAQGRVRENFAPVKSVLTPDVPGDPLALARAYRDVLGAQACYLADLDAIQGGPIQRGLIHDLVEFQTGFAGELMVDAAAADPDGALEVLSAGASDAIVGLETLRSFRDLAEVVKVVGANRVIFSLDLQLGSPILHPLMTDAGSSQPDAMALAGQAAAMGVGAILVLDLGRVGTGTGVDLGLLEALRRRHPAVRLFAGGGVLTRKDLERMEESGCDGALVASALHVGRITAEDVAALRHVAGVSQSDASDSR